MTQKVTLLTSKAAFEKLHTLVDSRGRNVRVDRQELLRLLIDHSIMYDALRGSTSFKVEEPTTKRKRIRAEGT